MTKESIWTLLLCLFVAVLSAPALGKKDEAKVDGKTIFAQHCAKCHANGGNLVSSAHPIIGSKQLASIVTFKEYLSAPPGHMPFYQDVVGSKKKLASLYEYGKSLKETPPKEAKVEQESTVACD